ncbi:MAG TPA: DUF4156 domain-containing protein [Luteibacter sp.]|jgi:hypothetical protein|nr:DUF4156 domain-containing protein [Luteibacter sp.]
MRKTLLLLVPVVLLSACTWGIKLDDTAKGVRTAWNGDVSGCQEQGKVTVSVMNRVGPVDRNDIKVRDELEVLARNEAAKMHADTIKPLAEPSEGSQPWAAYTCGARGPSSTPRPASSQPQPQGAQGATETYPVKN